MKIFVFYFFTVGAILDKEGFNMFYFIFLLW